jgi:putative tryptophan/tyrosine transport system substrate-binding protein
MTALGLVSRRGFLRGCLAAAGAGLHAGCGIPFGPAAKPARLHRIGFVRSGSGTLSGPNLAAFRQGMGELGYVEGQHFVLEERYADGRDEGVLELAEELTRLDVDIIVTGGVSAIRAVQRATSSIPIVFANTGDPVAEGLVASLARPGGNTTGVTSSAGEEHAKRLELLKETVPGLSRVAALWDQSLVGNIRETEAAAQKVGVQLLPLELPNADGIDAALAGAIVGRADGLVVTGGPVLGLVTPRIAAWATEHRMPAMYSSSPSIEAGGLLTYNANNFENYRRAASYVDKILKGARPADLPVEQPTKFDFIINLKTAQALGLTIPQSILQQATGIIQ